MTENSPVIRRRFNPKSSEEINYDSDWEEILKLPWTSSELEILNLMHEKRDSFLYIDNTLHHRSKDIQCCANAFNLIFRAHNSPYRFTSKFPGGHWAKGPYKIFKF